MIISVSRAISMTIARLFYPNIYRDKILQTRHIYGLQVKKSKYLMPTAKKFHVSDLVERLDFSITTSCVLECGVKRCGWSDLS